SNGTPDESESDCNTNGTLDSCDVSGGGGSADMNTNGIPDECEGDCNTNGTPDSVDITSAASPDLDSNGRPDECDFDCNTNGTPDSYDIAHSISTDANTDWIPDECEEGEGERMGAGEGGGGQSPQAALAAWDEANPSGGFATCQAYQFARAKVMASLGLDEG